MPTSTHLPALTPTPSAPIKGISWRRFTMSLATTAEEVIEVQRLRHHVFQAEWAGPGKDRSDGLDADELDASCDHLMLRDALTNLLIGTYRFRPTSRPGPGLCHEEFDDAGLAHLPGTSIELGRACLRQDWRNNAALIALMRGVGWYASLTKARFMVGNSSVLCTDPEGVAGLCRFFAANNHALPTLDLRPRPDFRLPGLPKALGAARVLTASMATQADHVLPPLLRLYLRAGAKVAFEPAWDQAYHCVDFLTILDWEQADPDFVKRFCKD